MFSFYFFSQMTVDTHPLITFSVFVFSRKLGEMGNGFAD